MLEIHNQNFLLSKEKNPDPIFYTAKKIGMKYNVLFLDEF